MIVNERNKAGGKHILAVGLLSGGLDSALAAKMMVDEGVTVIGLHFNTGFCISEVRQTVRRSKHRDKSYENMALKIGDELGIPIELLDISREFYDMLQAPKHGFGANVNPCIDCRILMLKKAKQYLNSNTSNGFLFTGEVVGQRPLSQHKQTLRLIEKEAAVEGILLRPLSAKLLRPTRAELEGWIRRENMLDISGRSRKRQMELSKLWDLTGFLSPGGGCCFLTDPGFARRYKDFRAHNPTARFDHDDLMLLVTGRYLRLDEQTRLIIGREQAENKVLENYRDRYWTVEAVEYKGPIALIIGALDDDKAKIIAGIIARYCQYKGSEPIAINFSSGKSNFVVYAAPLEDKIIHKWLI